MHPDLIAEHARLVTAARVQRAMSTQPGCLLGRVSHTRPVLVAAAALFGRRLAEPTGLRTSQAAAQTTQVVGSGGS